MLDTFSPTQLICCAVLLVSVIILLFMPRKDPTRKELTVCLGLDLVMAASLCALFYFRYYAQSSPVSIQAPTTFLNRFTLTAVVISIRMASDSYRLVRGHKNAHT
jgi:hypothetical protein